MLGKIVFAFVVLGCSYVYGQDLMRMAMMSKMLSGSSSSGSGGMGGMDPLMTMALLKGGGLMGGGSSKALNMMAMMNMLKPQSPAVATPGAGTTGGATPLTGGSAVATSSSPSMDPMTNTLMTMSLCQRSEAAAESRICTDMTCKLQSYARHGNPNLLKCQPLLGCCFADMRSMYIANTLKSL